MRNMRFGEQPNPGVNHAAAWKTFREHEFAAHALFNYAVDGLDIVPEISGYGEGQPLMDGEDLVTVTPYRLTFEPVDQLFAAGLVRFVLREEGHITAYDNDGSSETTTVHYLDVLDTSVEPPRLAGSFARPGITVRCDAEGNVVDEYLEPTEEAAEAECYAPPPSPHELATMQKDQYDYAGHLGSVCLARDLPAPVL